MKMVMPLLSPAAGTISFTLSEGAVVNAGDVIATLDLDDPTAVLKAKPFSGVLPELGPPVIESDTTEHRFKQTLEAIKMVLAGG